jgi:hypothetical protein
MPSPALPLPVETPGSLTPAQRGLFCGAHPPAGGREGTGDAARHGRLSVGCQVLPKLGRQIKLIRAASWVA